MKVKIYWLLTAILLLFLASCKDKPIAATQSPTPAPTPKPTPIVDGLVVDSTISLGDISPFVYGANHGPWAFVPIDLWEPLEASGVTFLRFPGGEWGDRNEIRGYQFDDFIATCKQIGAEPQVSVRLMGGTPEKAAELVRYANIEKEYNVKYWSIGNEPNLYANKAGGEGYDTLQFNRDWRTIATAMRAVDPDILILGPELSQYTSSSASNPKDISGIDWMESFLEANGDLVDIIAVHRYPFPRGLTSGNATADELLANPGEWDQIIPTLRSLIQETTGRDLPIAVTEINSYWSNATGGETSPDSFYSALWWTDVLGHLIQNKVEIVSFFSLQSSPNIGGYGMFSRRDVRPSYYTYQLYQRFGTELVHAASDDAKISVYAALQPDHSLTVLVVNRGAQAANKTLQTIHSGLAESATVWLFDAEYNVEEQPPQPWTELTSVILPPYSATLYVIPPLPNLQQ